MDFFDQKNEWNISPIESVKIRKKEVEDYFDFSDIRLENESLEPVEINIYIKPSLSVKEIHNNVRSRFCYEYLIYCEAQKDILYIEKIKTKIGYRYNERLFELITQRDNFNTRQLWNLYKEKAIPILERYIEVMPNEVKGVISNKILSFEEEKTLIETILEYIDIVTEFSNLEVKVFYEVEDDNYCSFCKMLFSSLRDGKCRCGIEIDNSYIPEEEAIQDFDIEKKTNTSPKAQLDWLDNFLGYGEYPELNEEFFEQMDQICIRESFPTSDEVKENPEDGTLDLLLTLMKYMGMKNYKLKNVIGKRYWDWELPSLTEEQKDQFKKDCILSREIYPQVSKRIQNLNLDVTGYFLLASQGLFFDNKFFKFPKPNSQIILNANEVWRDSCELTGINFVSL